MTPGTATSKVPNAHGIYGKLFLIRGETQVMVLLAELLAPS